MEARRFLQEGIGGGGREPVVSRGVRRGVPVPDEHCALRWISMDVGRRIRP